MFGAINVFFGGGCVSCAWLGARGTEGIKKQFLSSLLNMELRRPALGQGGGCGLRRLRDALSDGYQEHKAAVPLGRPWVSYPLTTTQRYVHLMACCGTKQRPMGWLTSEGRRPLTPGAAPLPRL